MTRADPGVPVVIDVAAGLIEDVAPGVRVSVPVAVEEAVNVAPGVAVGEGDAADEAAGVGEPLGAVSSMLIDLIDGVFEAFVGLKAIRDGSPPTPQGQIMVSLTIAGQALMPAGALNLKTCSPVTRWKP